MCFTNSNYKNKSAGRKGVLLVCIRCLSYMRRNLRQEIMQRNKQVVHERRETSQVASEEIPDNHKPQKSQIFEVLREN